MRTLIQSLGVTRPVPLGEALSHSWPQCPLSGRRGSLEHPPPGGSGRSQAQRLAPQKCPVSVSFRVSHCSEWVCFSESDIKLCVDLKLLRICSRLVNSQVLTSMASWCVQWEMCLNSWYMSAPRPPNTPAASQYPKPVSSPKWPEWEVPPFWLTWPNNTFPAPLCSPHSPQLSLPPPLFLASLDRHKFPHLFLNPFRVYH